MMKKLLAMVLSVMCVLYALPAGAQVYTTVSSEATVSGLKTSQLLGADGQPAQWLNGTASWKYIDGESAIFRIWCYMTIDEAATSSASFIIDSEHTKKTYTLDFTVGNSGWREICLANCGGAGITVTLQSDTDKPALVSAIRLEKLDGSYTTLMNFTKQNDTGYVFAKYAKTAYMGGTRVSLDKAPVFETDGIYIPVANVRDFVRVPVTVLRNSVSFGYNGKRIEANEINGFVKSINGTYMVNVSKLFELLGKTSFVYNNSLVIFTDEPVRYDAVKDALNLKSMVSSLRFNP